MKRVFLDSSVLFSAVNSPIGGSAKLFTLKNITLVASQVVLAEVERNVRIKLTPLHLPRFFRLAQKLTIVELTPNDELIAAAKKVIVDKDAMILSQAKEARTHSLVTLDRKHFLTKAVARFLAPQRVVTPKMLIENDL